METDNAQEIKDWLYIANADIDSALLLKQMRPQHREIICYHCQQAAEKYPKVFLVSCRIEAPKTHDLRLLCQLCEEQDISFSSLKLACSFLTPFGIQPRYPHEMDITEYTIEKALLYSKSVQNFEPIKHLIDTYCNPS
jgi:HEPN domain-containing protein